MELIAVEVLGWLRDSQATRLLDPVVDLAKSRFCVRVGHALDSRPIILIDIVCFKDSKYLLQRLLLAQPSLRL